MNYRKAITFEKFMELPAQERREHANFFHTNYPDYLPVILNIEHGGKKVPLKMCKYLSFHPDSSSGRSARWPSNSRSCVHSF